MRVVLYCPRMEKVTNALSRVLRPALRPCSHWLLSEKRTRYTWVYEYIVVGSILATVTVLTMDWASWRLIVGNVATGFGVFWSFGHAKVASRMMEAQAHIEKPTVPCYHMSDKYWVRKELAWFAAFLAFGMYPALVGNIIFLIYPAWRKIHLEGRLEVRGTVLAPDHMKTL